MAAKIDKKLAKKLAKMTEEERKIFLEEQRLVEEETKRKKEELLSRYLKDKLDKEHKSSQVNQLKLQSKWRDVMRQARSSELRREIETLSQTFERIVDRKDALIKSLMKDIDESDQQYHRALQSHLENINNLIRFQLTRLQEMEDKLQGELDVLRDMFDKERDDMMFHHKQDMHDLRDVGYAMELRHSEQHSEAQQEFQGLVDEIKNKNLEEKHALKVQRQAQIDELWQEFKQEAEQYRKNTEEQKMQFEALKKKDEQSSKQISRQMKRVQKLQEDITTVKARLATGAREFEASSSLIKENKEVVMKRFRELKEEMLRSRESERSKLTTLTMQSSDCSKQLKKLKEVSDDILRLAEMCRKLETEEEKVLPFYSCFLSPEEEAVAKESASEPPTEQLAKLLHEYSSLSNFWKRYNKVLVDKLALDKEKQALVGENHQLKALLKQYLDGISVNDDILTHNNPLLIVNHRTNAPLPVPVGDHRVKRRATTTVVEAAHVVKHIL